VSRSAAFDTSALVFLIDDAPPADAADARRWQNVRDTMRGLTDAGVTFALPAAVLAELAAGQHGRAVAALLAKRIGKIEVQAFDAEAALIAGEITQGALAAAKAAGTKVADRPIIKFDAMILATALRWKVDQLITTNGRDFAKYLKHTKLEIDVVHADETRGQVTLLGVR
jgi:predicted nucleic acid-binding protein